MGCSASAPNDEYVFHYVGDDVSPKHNPQRKTKKKQRTATSKVCAQEDDNLIDLPVDAPEPRKRTTSTHDTEAPSRKRTTSTQYLTHSRKSSELTSEDIDSIDRGNPNHSNKFNSLPKKSTAPRNPFDRSATSDGLLGHQKHGNTSPRTSPSKPSPSKSPTTKEGSFSAKQTAALKGKFKKAARETISTKTVADMFMDGNGKGRVSASHSWIAKDLPKSPAFAKEGTFTNVRVIGTGLMGTVVLTKHNPTALFCVLKMVKKDYICRHDDGRHIQMEREILTKVSNPFIANMFGTYQDKKFVYFVLEYCAGGELFSRLHNKKGCFGENTSRFYLSEILLALDHLHTLGYAYRDLKPENVMIDEAGHVKLIDFGFSTKPDRNGLLHTNVGTPAYLSPEQLNYKKTGGYRIFVDFWSFGILAYEFMTGTTPFCRNHKESSYAIYMRVLKGKISFPGYFSAHAKDLVKGLLVADVEKRIKDVGAVKSHPFFSSVGVDWNRIERVQAVPPHAPKLKEAGDNHYFDTYGDIDEREMKPDKIDNSVFFGF
jgi:hypothetical protein